MYKYVMSAMMHLQMAATIFTTLSRTNVWVINSSWEHNPNCDANSIFGTNTETTIFYGPLRVATDIRLQPNCFWYKDIGYKVFYKIVKNIMDEKLQNSYKVGLVKNS